MYEKIRDFRIVRYGIPQGMNLDPNLFSTYNLLELYINGNILAFAYDIILFLEFENWNEEGAKVNLRIDIIQKNT